MRNTTLLLLLAVFHITSGLITVPINKNIPELAISNGEDAATQAIDHLVNYSQMMYAGEIQLGHSQQTFIIDFDSGSNLLWLTSKNSATCQKAGYKNAYVCSASDGCNITTTPGSVTYGDGSSVSGHIANVPVSIAGLAPVTEALLLVEKCVNSDHLSSDGLMGLGVYDAHNPSSNSYVTQLFNAGLIEKNEFSFFLGFEQNESELVFGGFDASKVANASEIFYTPLIVNGKQNDSQRWSIGLKSFSVGSLTVPTKANNNVAIVDSGTSLVAIRKDYYTQFINYLKKNFSLTPIMSGSAVFQKVKCGTALPDLTFTLTDVNGVDRDYSIPSSFYILNQSNICFIGIQPLQTMDVQFILGDIFMRRFVSIFSNTDKTMGLTISTVQAPSTAQVNETGSLVNKIAIVAAFASILLVAIRAYLRR